MAVCTIYLISLRRDGAVAGVLAALRNAGASIVFQARILRWMILPTQLSAGRLLGRNQGWDLLICLEGSQSLPDNVKPQIRDVWAISCGVSSKSLSGYESLNAGLLRPKPGSGAPRQAAPVELKTASSSQKLEVSEETLQWLQSIKQLPEWFSQHPVSMLNLLAFNPGEAAHKSYQQYGKEFSSKVGSQHGGHVKVVGRVIEGDAKKDDWNEIAFVHYPSVAHFVGMAGSEAYQDVNQRLRVPALKDTFILCSMEIDDLGRPVNAPETGVGDRIWATL